MSSSSLARTFSVLRWMPMVKGVLAVAAAITAVAWPGPTATVLILVLGAYIGVDAVITLVWSLRSRGLPGNRALIVWGVVGVLAAALMLWHPSPVLRLLVVLIGAVLVLGGLLLGAVAVPLVPLTRRAWIGPVVGGVVSLALGLACLIHPSFGVAAMSWLIGLGMLVYGLVHIGLWVGLRRLSAHPGAAGEDSPTTIEGEVVEDQEPGSTQR